MVLALGEDLKGSAPKQMAVLKLWPKLRKTELQTIPGADRATVRKDGLGEDPD